MTFKVTDARRLREEADRIENILLSPHHRGTTWDEGDFVAYLQSIGLSYEKEELKAIRDELISRGVVEIVE